jgi:RimJ/RimL family protein N-acetyltransferase
MPDDAFTFRAATPADIAAITAIETLPGYWRLVGHWPAEQHRAEMALPSSRYLVAEGEKGDVAGFVILQGIGGADGRVHLKRIAVDRPGGGLGSALLRHAVDWLFTETDAHRLDLDVHAGNDRARRAYEKAGFRAEGLMRDYHRLADGSFVSVWMMAILRPEWQAAKAGAAP